jgi:hypothetical protein
MQLDFSIETFEYDRDSLGIFAGRMVKAKKKKFKLKLFKDEDITQESDKPFIENLATQWVD